ncbi:unnamed protein product [Citrullus colocynthis]|uniref:Uncharacterized protein n=1 Tax=Citrullus colocynthis TaxID=252529 RepID=A0ABP0YI06_9ROSI
MTADLIPLRHDTTSPNDVDITARGGNLAHQQFWIGVSVSQTQNSPVLPLPHRSIRTQRSQIAIISKLSLIESELNLPPSATALSHRLFHRPHRFNFQHLSDNRY